MKSLNFKKLQGEKLNNTKNLRFLLFFTLTKSKHLKQTFYKQLRFLRIFYSITLFYNMQDATQVYDENFNNQEEIQWYRQSPKVLNSTFYTVEFDKLQLPINVFELERCVKCQGYLNCFCEIIAPGQKWICVLCGSENRVDVPFTYLNNNYRQTETVEFYNKITFEHPMLTSNIFEIEAPEGFNIKSTDAPTLVFNIEVTLQSERNALLPSLLTSIKESLKAAVEEGKYDTRTKVAFIFYSDHLFVLNKNKTMTAITGAIPQVLRDEICFNLYEDFEEMTNLFNSLETYFANTHTNGNCLLQSMQFISSVFKSASVYTFMCSMPNTGSGMLKESNKLVESEAYKKVTISMDIKAIAMNLFMCTKQTLELAQFRSLVSTGGQIFHYTNYDGEDSTYTEKLYADLNELINSEVSYNALMRIRASEGLVVKRKVGNFIQRENNLCAFANYNSKHSISFEVQGDQDKYVQIAMVRTRKNGIKTIRIATFFNRTPENCFNSINQCALGFMQIAQEKEFIKQGTGGIFLDQTLKSIINDSSLKISNHELAMFFSAYKKNLIFDQSISSDFRAYYAYLLTNSSISICDKISYPLLVDLTNLESALPLSKNSINDESIYLLDSGVNLYIFIGKNNENYGEFFEEVPVSGLCLLDNFSQNENGKYLAETIAWLTNGCTIKPKYIVVVDRENSPLSEIFRKHLYDDSQKNIPDAMTYYNSLLNN
ncbi:SEC24 [Ecytonucleospora hepatopenaei]|uniref:SEC24 n=1 Tax=Ecytonucleospora hepatopenaei TaxID=646526 RepID=A0A1W0E7R7_9MICR|nr:SEC24 [Ecytonucleospora hepatopenaei]